MSIRPHHPVPVVPHRDVRPQFVQHSILDAPDAAQVVHRLEGPLAALVHDTLGKSWPDPLQVLEFFRGCLVNVNGPGQGALFPRPRPGGRATLAGTRWTFLRGGPGRVDRGGGWLNLLLWVGHTYVNKGPQLLQPGGADALDLNQVVHAAERALAAAVLLDLPGEVFTDTGQLHQVCPLRPVQVDLPGRTVQ